MGRREREGAQARAYDEGGQAGRRGQEQGAGRSSGTGRAGKLAGGVGGEGTYGQSEAGRCARMRAAWWGSAEQKLKLICFYFIQLQLPINILL